MLFSIQYNEQGVPFMQASMSPFTELWDKDREDSDESRS